MKVRIYKAGGGVGKFISKLDKFLPTAAQGTQVDQMKQLKEAIKYQLDDKNQSESSVVLQLIRGGYDYAYAKDLVDTVSEEIEEDYYSKKNKKGKTEEESMMDSDLIPNEEDLAEEKDRQKRKLSYQNMSDDIAQTAEDAQYDDEDDDNEFNEMLEAGSPYDEETPTAAYGMEVNDPKIQWPGMFNDMASFKNGGAPNKNKFIKSTVKKLKKAAAGMQKDPSMNDMPSPYGTLENPLGINLTPNKSVVSAIKGTAQNYVNEEAFKKQAEQMYNQQFMQPMAANGGASDWATNLHNYGEALSHQMPNMNMNAMNTQYNNQEMSFGGTSRRVRRANKAFFGLPIVPPGAKTDYQFGPLGGLKRGQVEYDLGQIGELLKTNPQLANMLMPKIGMGMPSGGWWNRWTSNAPAFNPFGGGFGSYGSSSSSYSYGTPKTRLKWATETVNNAADPAKNDEAAKLKNNSDQTDQKKKYQDYIDWYLSSGTTPGMSKAAPVSFEEFIAKDEDGLSEYDWWVKTRSNTTPSSTATNAKVETKTETPKSNTPVKSNAAKTPAKKSTVQNKPAQPDPSQDATTINAANAAPAKPKTVTPAKPKTPQAKTYASDDEGDGFGFWDYVGLGAKLLYPGAAGWFEDGGFVDFDRPDLNRFVYGGNEYAYGGGVRYDGGGNVDLNMKDPAGRNYQQYIDWYNETPLEKGMSRAAPQTWAEWSAENKPTGSGTNTGNTGTTTYDQTYFQNMFKNDPAFKQGFEQFMKSQGLPTNSQLQQRQQQGQGTTTNFSKGDGMGGPDPRGAMRWTNREGTPVVGFGPANQNFGSMLGRAFGISKDFNYYTSPQGQITREMISQMMQGKNPTGKVTETKFKDRGKWWNPFDTKRVTEWTVDGAGQPTPAAKTTQGPGNAPGYNPTAAGPGYSGYNADSDGNGMPDYLQVPNPQDGTGSGANTPMAGTYASSGAPYNTAGPMNTGENTGIQEDFQPNQAAMDYMRQSLSLGQGNTTGTTTTTGTAQPGATPAAGTNVPNTGRNEDIPRGMFLQTSPAGGIDRKGRLVMYRDEDRPAASTPAPTTQGQIPTALQNFLSGQGQSQGTTQPIPIFNKQQTGNYQDFNQSNMPNARIDGTAQPAPAAEPLPENFLMNTSGPMNTMEEGMAYGGYIPGYMAYGGYMPDYGFGGYYPDGGSTVVGPNQDFAGPQQNNIAQDADNNGIPDYLELGKDPAMGADANTGPTKYRLEEQSAFTWDPRKTAMGIDQSLRGVTKGLNMAAFTKGREKENAEYMYAQDIDKQGRYRGLGDPNEGVWKDNIGFESGRTYASKYGGPKFANGGSQYAKGKVYSLTMDEINEIKRRGGSVKFIK